MGIEKRLAKITSAYVGLGGYQGVQFGFYLNFGGDGWGCGSPGGACWDPASMKRDNNCEWTEEGRDKSLAKLCREISKTLNEAKVDRVQKLVGIPVELTLENFGLKSWRILTEVL